MKRTTYLLLLLILVALLPATARQRENKVLTPKHVTVPAYELVRTPDNLVYFSLDIHLSEDFRMSSNRVTTLTPLFHGLRETRTHDFTPAYVYGRRRHIIDQRAGLVPTDAYSIVRRDRGDEQVIQYHGTLPYEAWMEEGSLELCVDLCGCAGKQQELLYIPIGRLLSPFDPTPFISFETPKVTGPKVFTAEGSAYIDFRVDKINLDPTYRRNPQELRRIYASIDSVRGGDNQGITHIDSITIKGYASPEGRYSRNVYLAKNRARTLTEYVRNEYALTDVPFIVDFEPEDWEGLRRRVSEGQWAEKEEILAIIDDPAITDPDARNNRLARLPIYKQLLADVYPALRHSDYVIFYTVRGFNDDELAGIYQTRPWMLSQNELYRLSLTMEPGTDEYNELFMSAARRFPTDSVANLNAMAVALQMGNASLAKKYEPHIGQSAEAQCNRAILAYLEGHPADGYTLFQQAALMGSKQAQAALAELKRRQTLMDNK